MYSRSMVYKDYIATLQMKKKKLPPISVYLCGISSLKCISAFELHDRWKSHIWEK